jgi:hypothetical protein
LAVGVTALCCHATQLERQRDVSCDALLPQIVALVNFKLRLSVPLLGFRQLRSKLLAGRHTSTVDVRRRETQTLLLHRCCCDVASPRQPPCSSCGKERKASECSVVVVEEKKAKENKRLGNPNSSARLLYLLFVVQRDNEGADQTVRWMTV